MTMSTSSPEPSDPRSLIRYGVLWLAIAITVLWTLYLIRSQLLLIYVCILFATGLSPLVRWIERRRASGRRRLPRPAAILLIYATVIGIIVAIGFAVLPPLIEQSQAFWRDLPDRIDSIQARLVSWG
jgi:predicted PurR-regulated permease PerM